jgi:hypothetical protein
MKEIGRWGMPAVMAPFYMWMETSTKVNGKTTSATDMESIQTRKEQGMKATGRMTHSGVKEQKSGLREASILASTKTVRSKGTEPTHGPTDLCIREIG